MEYNITFKLDETQLISISVDNDKELCIKPSILFNKILGFNNEDYIVNKENSITATNTWDLRFHDKLFLYIKNINQNPISILYFNARSDSTINFDEPIDINQFNIEIRDISNNLYDFNGLSHSINIQLEISNDLFDDTDSLKNKNELTNDYINNIKNNLDQIAVDI